MQIPYQYKSILFTLLLLFSMTGLGAQTNMSARFELKNESSINDGSATIFIQGGKTPYTYKWSNKSTSLDQSTSLGLTEGREFSVEVTDADGQKEIFKNKIPTETVTETINSLFIPPVHFMEEILFFDPFTTIGIYDPIIYNEQGEALTHPNGDHKKQNIPLVVVVLVFGALFFTFRMGFVNITKFKMALDLVAGKYDDPKSKGEVSHFQALTTALSATVGLGNIAGVAVAVVAGGPGATFWMIIAGFIGMSSKFVGCTLGVKYRTILFNGEVSGGPMYYIEQGFAKFGSTPKVIGKVFAVTFAILCVGGSFGGGNMFQSNQAFAQVNDAALKLNYTGLNGTIFGIVLAILVGLVIVGGLKSIAKVTDKIVPAMCGLYVLSALIIIIMHFDQVGSVFQLIFSEAFTSDALKGGTLGVLITGFQRAAFSNEAGVGSAAIAHSATKTEHPISEGIVAMLGPFIDTVVICTMTALVIIFTGLYAETSVSGTALTSLAFESSIPGASWVLTIAVLLFAFSTMISWSYYGLKAWTYLFGQSFASKTSYKIIFLCFIVVGSSVGLGAVLDFSDMMILGMAFPNIIGLIVLSSEVAKDKKAFFAKIKSGEIKKQN